MASKKKIKITDYDAAEYLRSEEEIAAYLEECAEEKDPDIMLIAFADAARARNMIQLAKDVGISRAGLYKALSVHGNPSFSTIFKLVSALGIQMTFKPSSSALRR